MGISNLYIFIIFFLICLRYGINIEYNEKEKFKMPCS